ncbi:MAG: prephenate dehydratase [Bacteroidales bacterium]|nr:prephenate dehydratase [Bacteroidales bacterium]MDD3166682.1 prephenate dehydratase [Bacteroidales bacterium]MDD4769899.1 prephenate dehydratase [Bacteroidales bacterium]HKL93627.1 prephenate dehydratase [Bacteroidales bacterium]
MKHVAIQGIAGAYHDIAARSFFEGEDIEIIGCHSFKEVFATLRKDNNTLGIIAIENTIAGSLLQNHNLLRESDTSIIGEYKLRISHNLAAMPGQKLEDIREVHSHPIALMQCEDFLAEHPDWKVVESEDTAWSAKDIQEGKIMGRAAICSSLAAEVYNLDVLSPGIETNKRNFTRFLILSDRWNAEQYNTTSEINKASIVLTTQHTSGALAQVLSVLSYFQNNLSKIQSMPIMGHEWEYLFYIDLTFEDYMKYKQSLDAIRPLTKNLKILGEYKQGKQKI